MMVVLTDNAISNISNSNFENLPNLWYLSLHGNKIAEMPNGFLLTMPNLAFFLVSSNELREIPYFSSPFKQLKFLFLDSNRIVNVSRDSLVLEGLENLDLHQNEIENVDHFAFQYLTSLVKLNMSFNLLKQAPSFVTTSGNSLTLDLSNNQIQSVDENSFASLKSVKSLLLVSNKISHINPIGLDSLLSLEDLDLTNNSLTCDCSLYPFSGWLRLHRGIYVKGAVCNSPEKWKGIDIGSLNWVNLCQKECGLLVVATILFILAIVYLICQERYEK